MGSILKRYYNTNNYIVSCLIILIYYIALTIELNFIFTNEFYIESLKQNHNFDKINSLIEMDRNVEWVNYIFVFIIILIPTIFISMSLNIAAIFKEYKVKYSNIFNIVLKSQIIFSINYLISIILRWQGILENKIETINNNFNYQSVLSLINSKALPEWSIYPLQVINVTEIVYVFILAYGIKELFKIKYNKSLLLVIVCYISILIIWIVFSFLLKTILYR